MNYRQLCQRLSKTYDTGEAQAIARMLYEVRYGLTLADLLMGRDNEVPQDEIELMARRLLQEEPIQYVLGETVFCSHRLRVTPAVLIPRPETEELCQWVIAEAEATDHVLLDIGTGSGCIAITLACQLPHAAVEGWDISAEALNVARHNAALNGASVTFRQVDILNLPPEAYPTPPCPHYDTIVSNPPYICRHERQTMQPNVLDYEPHTALFVPDDDPLLFYKAIARYAQQALGDGGRLYFEINPLYATALQAMLSAMSFRNITIRQDSYGRQRMIRAQR